MVERCRLQGHSQLTAKLNDEWQPASRVQRHGDALYRPALQCKASAAPGTAGQHASTQSSRDSIRVPSKSNP